MRCAAASYYDRYHAFEPRPGELGGRALAAAREVIPASCECDRHRVVDGDRRVVVTGSRDECLDAVERAWWRVEAATLATAKVAAASRAVELAFERWEQGRGFVPDLFLTDLELAQHAGA